MESKGQKLLTLFWTFSRSARSPLGGGYAMFRHPERSGGDAKWIGKRTSWIPWSSAVGAPCAGHQLGDADRLQGGGLLGGAAVYAGRGAALGVW